jgi:hypothetical protein
MTCAVSINLRRQTHIHFPKSLDLGFDLWNVIFGVFSLAWAVSIIDLPLDSGCAAPTYNHMKGLCLSMVLNLFNFSLEVGFGFFDGLSVEINCVECASL